jgi:uncharacterized protein YyaL (SSP411 family)
LEERAARIGRAFSGSVKESPAAYTQLMVALDFAIGPSYEVVIVGDPHAEDTAAMIKELGRRFLPNEVALLNRSDGKSPEMASLAEFTRDQSSIGGKATAYVCVNHTCKSPTTDVNKMLQLLDAL